MTSLILTLAYRVARGAEIGVVVAEGQRWTGHPLRSVAATPDPRRDIRIVGLPVGEHLESLYATTRGDSGSLVSTTSAGTITWGSAG